MKRALSILTLLIASFALLGCAATATRPDEIKASSAIGEDFKCSPETAGGDHDHFIVGWSDDSRAALETVMNRGIAVVKYDCSGVQVLKACSVDGGYGYQAISKKTKLIEMKDSGAIQANLGGNVQLPSKFKAELSQGRQLNLAYVLVGTQSADVTNVTKANLSGRCDGATHFVFEAQLGAFILATGEQGHAYAAADLLGYGSASAELDSEKSARTTDGDVVACDDAGEGDQASVAGCKALLRTTLLKVD